MQPTSNDSSTAAALAAGAALAQPRQNPEPHGAAYTVVPPGYEVAELPRLGQPLHPKGMVKLRDAASFIQYVNDHANSDSRIFATLDPARFLAVFDEFLCDPDYALGMEGQANWREFRAEFAVPPSREWLLWNAANRKHMSQLGFAEFLQDNLPDVVQPSGAELLEVSLQFEASQSGQFISAQRLQDGSHNLVWKADNSGDTVKLPEFIRLAIPVFENEAPRDIDARLRYRVKDGVLAIWFELVRPHKVLEAAFRQTWDRIKAETKCVILLGTPE